MQRCKVYVYNPGANGFFQSEITIYQLSEN